MALTMRDLAGHVRPILKDAGFTSKGHLYTRETSFGRAYVAFAKVHVPEYARTGRYTLACEITYGYVSHAQRDYSFDLAGQDPGPFSMLGALFFYGLLVPRRQFPGWTHRDFPYRWPLEFEPADHLWTTLESYIGTKVVADVESWSSPKTLRRILDGTQSSRHAYRYPLGSNPEFRLALGLVDTGDRSLIESLLPALPDDRRSWIERRLRARSA